MKESADHLNAVARGIDDRAYAENARLLMKVRVD